CFHPSGAVCGTALRQLAVSALLLQRTAAVDVLRDFAAKCDEHDGCKPAGYHEGVFPTTRIAAIGGAFGARGFQHLTFNVRRDDGVLQGAALAGVAVASLLSAACRVHRPRLRALARGAERYLSRCAVRGAIPH